MKSKDTKSKKKSAHPKELDVQKQPEFQNQRLKNGFDKKKVKRTLFWITIISIVLFFGAGFLVPKIFEGTVVADIIRDNVIGVINIVNFFENNLDTILRTFTTLFVSVLFLWLILYIVGRFSMGSQRQRTIVTLVTSFIRYTGAIVIFLIMLGIWGVDTTTLLAGVGALALIIGFGAQSLIADILAGLFIVFENGFQVDDIILVDGFRGTVVEIGLRTTRFQDPGGDIKTINNAELKTYINMSRANSMALIDFTIEYGENVVKVEKLITTNFPAIQKKLPAIISIKYLGLASFTERGSLLRLCAFCKEIDRLQLIRDLNREIKVLLDKNKIKIAVTQIRTK